MDEIDWSDNNEEPPHQSSGCGFLFLLMVLVCIPIGFLFVKAIDALVYEPREQIRAHISDFVNIPPYDPRDNSFSIEEIEQPSEDMVWYDVKIKENENGRIGREYSFLVKARLKERLFLSTKIEIMQVFEE